MTQRLPGGSAGLAGSHRERLCKPVAPSRPAAGGLRPNPMPSYRYPAWQFRASGQTVDHLAEILMVLRTFGPFEHEPDSLRRSTGWGEAEWFLSPHVLLHGATPAEALAVDPAGMLQAARTEYG